MARVGFIGVGNMGSLMARNLIKAGHSLKVFDLNDEAVNFVVQSGAERAPSAKRPREAAIETLTATCRHGGERSAARSSCDGTPFVQPWPLVRSAGLATLDTGSG